MIYDGHVHLESGEIIDFKEGLKKSQVEGAVLLSRSPKFFSNCSQSPEWEKRLKELMKWAQDVPNIFPFYWIDPTEEDALPQVERAVEAGVAGFKSICTHFYPGDDVPMTIWHKVAKMGKPLIFHSGILIGDGDSKYNRPLHFEALLSVPNLKFALAHISWPWSDECLAVYAKWSNCIHKGLITSEMYIDTTRGTPESYREEVFYKLFNLGHPIEDNLLFGTDLRSSYNEQTAVSHIAKDKAILDKLGIDKNQQEKYFSKNLRRFVGR